MDARLASEFEKREEALVEMQKTMSKMRMQLQIQSNNWRQFMARNKVRAASFCARRGIFSADF